MNTRPDPADPLRDPLPPRPTDPLREPPLRESPLRESPLREPPLREEDKTGHIRHTDSRATTSSSMLGLVAVAAVIAILGAYFFAGEEPSPTPTPGEKSTIETPK
jgi:hypothetical protein